MQTEYCSISNESIFKNRIEDLIHLRQMLENEWIENYGSSTLRRAKRLGAVYKGLYMHERICFEFGPFFEYLPRSRILFGDAISEADCPEITEAQWLAERYLLRKVFPEDHLEYKCIRVTHPNDVAKIEREGFGLILRKTSASFIGGNIAFCFIVEWDLDKKTWKNVINPC